MAGVEIQQVNTDVAHVFSDDFEVKVIDIKKVWDSLLFLMPLFNEDLTILYTNTE